MRNTASCTRMILVSLTLALQWVAAAPVFAENSPPRSALQAEFHSAFHAMLSDPSSADKTVRYAELAVKLGDYEAAIPPLERLLMLNPRLPRVRLEVGVLYYLLNSREVARGYLTDVTRDPAADAALIERANAYLARL